MDDKIRRILKSKRLQKTIKHLFERVQDTMSNIILLQ